MIKVLIVDDSRTSRTALRAILERDPDIYVIGEASDGGQARTLIQQYDPHFVTMDIYLAGENGLDLTKSIMSKSPRPILVVTGVNANDPELIYQAIERGALDVFPKPPPPGHADYPKQSAQLIRLVKTLSKVPILHQQKRHSATVHPPLFDMLSDDEPKSGRQSNRIDLLLIGASTGGPPVVSGILERLPKPCPIPIVVVQHITKGFAGGFAEWLSHASGLTTKLVERTTMLGPGTVYIAPDAADLVFSSPKTLRPAPVGDQMGPNPNIDRLYRSAAEYCRGHIAAVVLTGMGSDGTVGLFKLQQAGATTIVQDPATCAIDSMPKSAMNCGAVEHILAPDKIVSFLKRRVT